MEPPNNNFSVCAQLGLPLSIPKSTRHRLFDLFNYLTIYTTSAKHLAGSTGLLLSRQDCFSFSSFLVVNVSVSVRRFICFCSSGSFSTGLPLFLNFAQLSNSLISFTRFSPVREFNRAGVEKDCRERGANLSTVHRTCRTQEQAAQNGPEKFTKGVWKQGTNQRRVWKQGTNPPEGMGKGIKTGAKGHTRLPGERDGTN